MADELEFVGAENVAGEVVCAQAEVAVFPKCWRDAGEAGELEGDGFLLRGREAVALGEGGEVVGFGEVLGFVDGLVEALLEFGSETVMDEGGRVRRGSG